MISFLKQWSNDLVSLFYPQYCIECEQEIHNSMKIFCTQCHLKVGYTDHFEISQNELIRRVSPRIFPEHAAALLGYVKEGVVQKAIHKLKYSGRYDVGQYFGEIFGEAYQKSTLFNNADLIVPIPIHKSRLRKRQYNQSETFAQGIFSQTQIPVDTTTLIKCKSQHSQTKKGRVDRFDAVLDTFKIINGNRLRGKRVLLVDDVLTTGATIEAAYSMLNQIPDIKIQLGLIALANN